MAGPICFVSSSPSKPYRTFGQPPPVATTVTVERSPKNRDVRPKPSHFPAPIPATSDQTTHWALRPTSPGVLSRQPQAKPPSDGGAPRPANLSPPSLPQITTLGGGSTAWNPAGLPTFGLFLDPFRPDLDFASGIRIDPCIVGNLVVKFCGHRRWSDRRSVGSTRRRLGWRVGARPAPSDGVV
ncbi:hypothetical protein M0R45_016192 [Rubus argutus]|uniref:Uncharacterized protein n=1 Tax=Rubus argutus TaxID=59490 RepID=A0AAW1XVH0_RUBAR